MKVVIADTLAASITKLDGDSQAAVKQTVFDFQVDPKRPGFSYHRVHRARDKNFWTIRVNDDIRVVIHRKGDTNVLCYADHHDDAYRWAEKRKLEVHPETGAAQFVVVDERVEEVVRRVVKEVEEEPAVFRNHDDDYLMALGVPAEFLDAVKHVGASRLDDLIGVVPDEAMERLMELAEGRPVPRPAPTKTEPFEHPDAQRRFKVVDSADELRQALEAGWERWVVFLHPAQRGAVDKTYNGPAKVSGTAGTGKTVVAMHRAASLARQGRNVLLTTFSSTLASRLGQHVEHLFAGDEAARDNVRVVHLHKLARDVWVRFNKRNLKILDRQTLEGHLRQADQAAGSSGFDLSFLRAEWEHVVDPNGVQSWEEYRKVSRAGRGTPLGAKQRRKLWAVFEKARASTGAAGLLSWDQVCREAAELLGRNADLRFDSVVADEVQDFGPTELRLLRALAPEGADDLFLCGDPGQRIYKMRSSWAAAGINVRGRSTRLKVNYRTTDQIRRFSGGLLAETLETDDGEEESRETVSLLSGPEPEVQGFDDVQGEVDGVAAWLKPLVQEGYQPRDIAVFGRIDAVVGDRAKPAVEAAGLDWARLRDDEELAEGCAAVGTMHRAKGLEFKVVVIVGCDKGLLPLSAALRNVVDPADKEAAWEHERNLLYVACTRARERLLVTYSGSRSELLASSA